jgi:hypothetical protein
MFRFGHLIKFAAIAVIFAGCSSYANATTVFDFSYKFVDNTNPNIIVGTVSGSFTGSGDVSDITDITNIHMNLDGAPLAGSFTAFSYAPTSQNCGSASCFAPGGAMVSNNTSTENFVFSTATTTSGLADSSYFYIIHPWANGSPPPFSDSVATQYAYGSSPQTYIDYYNGQFIPGNFNVSAVPEPSTWAMLILGFATMGAMTYRRRRKIAMCAA